MLNEFLFTKIEEDNIDNIWFQKDCPTCHTAEVTLDVLRPVFRKSHYQPQSLCRLTTSELRFDTVGLLFMGCRKCKQNTQTTITKTTCLYLQRFHESNDIRRSLVGSVLAY